MHIPPPFRRDDPATLQSAMRRFQTATLVSHGASGLMATHVPIEVAESPSPLGRLRCHFARANPHAEMIAEADEVLAIFHGPEGYISPNWYPSKAQNSKVVPTWNYASIHAYGTAKSFTDPKRLERSSASSPIVMRRGKQRHGQLMMRRMIISTACCRRSLASRSPSAGLRVSGKCRKTVLLKTSRGLFMACRPKAIPAASHWPMKYRKRYNRR